MWIITCPFADDITRSFDGPEQNTCETSMDFVFLLKTMLTKTPDYMRRTNGLVEVMCIRCHMESYTTWEKVCNHRSCFDTIRILQL